MARLIAKRPILHLANQYMAGDELPQDDPKMVSLWLKYGSAAYDGEKPKEEVKKTKKTPKKGA